MGTKVTISPITNPENSSFPTELNAAIDTLADEFDSVVYRDGSFDMEGDLDMGGNRLYNLPEPTTATEPMRLIDATAFQGTPGTDGADAENPNFTFDIATGLAGTDATLDVTGTYPNLNLAFTLPRGLAGASGALSDGVYSSIVVSGAGTALDLVNNSVVLGKLATQAAGTVLANATGGAASPTAVTYAALKTAMAFVKADVGLGNVDNTSDASKPVSTATQTALDLKADDSDLTTLTTTVDGKASKFLTVTNIAVDTTVADSHNNSLLRFTGTTARVITLNGTPTAGMSVICAHRGTVASWTLAGASGIYLNGAASTTTSVTVAPGAHFTLIHEGSGVWTADGTGLS